MSSPFALGKWLALFQDWTVFAEGLLTTATVAAMGLVLALALGVFFGVCSTTRVKVLRGVARVYVEFIQNTPLVIQIFFLYNGLPYMGVVMPKLLIGVLGVGVYHGAYIAEVVRSGIQAVPKGQVEAAMSQGFTYVQAMRHIVIPQAMRLILPPLTNQAVNLIKNTSVLAVIAGGDLMYRTDSWSSGNAFYGPAYVMSGLLYFAICYPLARWAKKQERRNRPQKSIRVVSYARLEEADRENGGEVKA